MVKKSILALFSLIFAFAIMSPQKANAQVSVGVGIGGGPYVAQPYAYVGPGYVCGPGFFRNYYGTCAPAYGLYGRGYYGVRGYYGGRGYYGREHYAPRGGYEHGGGYARGGGYAHGGGRGR